jgi:hypothetical protein
MTTEDACMLIGPGAGVSVELGVSRHPREQWEEIHERHRSHYARPEGGRPREESPRAVAVGKAWHHRDSLTPF